MLKRLFGLVFQELPSLEEAAGITRDRALQGRQDAIDVIKRTLGEMENNPVALQMQEVLSEIMDSPSLITDEIFNNIMSKTGEVLDASYDAEVGQFLDAARARGIAGPALQTQLQRAKQAKSSALAGAYRDAIIARAKEGKQTQLEAVRIGNSLLSNLFDQKRVLTEDLANVLQSVVEEPFVNPGPPRLPQAPGGAGGGGGGGFSSIDYKGRIGPRLGEDTSGGGGGYDPTDYDGVAYPNQPKLTNAERFGLTGQVKELQTQVDKQKSLTDQQQAFANQRAYLDSGETPPMLDASGKLQSTADYAKAAAESLQKAGLSAGSEGAEGLAGRVSQYSQPGGSVSPPPGGSVGMLTPGVQRMDFGRPKENTMRLSSGETISFGGGAAGAAHAESLAKQYQPGSIIGTSAGAGVRLNPDGSVYQEDDSERGSGFWTTTYESDGEGGARAKGRKWNSTAGWSKEEADRARSATGGTGGMSPPSRRGSELLGQFVGEHQAARRARKAGETPKTGAGTVIRTSSGFGVRR